MPVELPAKPGAALRQGGFVLTGRHVLLMLLGFFGAISLVNLCFITLALRTMPGAEVKSAFEQSQKFNRGLEAIAAQDRKAWQVEVVTGGLRAGAPLTVQLRDKAGVALLGLRVFVDLLRPTDARLDRHLDLIEQGNGVYAATMPEVEPGAWRVALEVKRGSEREFYSEARIVAKE